jgi:hypothetical protein
MPSILTGRSASSRALPATLLLACTVLAAACAPTATVRGEWQEGVSRGQIFTRVLVVGVSPHLNQRCGFEHFLASSLTSEATTAIASCDVIPHGDPIAREAIDKVITEYRLDAVLATSLIAGQATASEGGSRDTRGSATFKAVDSGWAYYNGFYGAYGVPVVYGEFVSSPSILDMQGEVELLSRLYETRGASVVYSLTTKARDIRSRADGLAMVTPPIADRLRREGLIR